MTGRRARSSLTDSSSTAGISGDQQPFISFVVPVYGSPQSLEPLCDRVRDVCAKLGATHEVILVDDRCPRESWTTIQQLAEHDPAVVGVRLSRNFGQHAAIQAGLSLVRGAWVVVMDCDLQDRPEEVPSLYSKAKEGFDVVRARRVKRNDPWHRRLVSGLFYRLLGFLTGTEQNPEVANFGIYHRKVIDTITCWQEDVKYFPAIVQWVGFKRTEIEVEHGERYDGRSSYNFRKLVNLALNVIIGFSDKPLKLVMTAGLAVAAVSFVISLVILVLHLAGAIAVEGWTSVVLSLWFLAGCLAFAFGLSGLYIGRILVEAKGRPTFIIDEWIGETADLRAAPAPWRSEPVAWSENKSAVSLKELRFARTRIAMGCD